MNEFSLNERGQVKLDPLVGGSSLQLVLPAVSLRGQDTVQQYSCGHRFTRHPVAQRGQQGQCLTSSL